MITVAGEALYDVFPRSTAPQMAQNEQVETQILLDAVTGGSPFNVAAGLGRLGHAPFFFGGIARGALGDRQTDYLEQAGVQMQAVLRKPNLVPLMLIDLADDGQPSYSYYGQSTADVAVTSEDLNILPRLPEVLHLGSYSLVMPPIADTLAQLVHRLPDTSLLALDPNVRAMIEPDRSVWLDRLEPLYQRADILKLSDEDVAFLAPDQAPQDYANALHKRSGAPVFLTMGDAGVVVFANGQSGAVPAPPTKVVDTVGAGDSFQTVLLAWASREEAKQALHTRTTTLQTVLSIAEVAVAVAAQICAQKGPVMPQADKLEAAISPRLFQRIAKIS